MIRFVRSLFGLKVPTNNRTVVGNKVPVDSKQAGYIGDSNTRLQVLFNLYHRYKGTPHALQMKAVYDKTKNIHDYLVSRNRIHELALFHIQNTEHFINAFTVILDAYQRLPDPNPASAETGTKTNFRRENLNLERRSARVEAGNPQEPVNPGINPASFPPPEGPGTKIPRLSVPDIRINPTARVLYYFQEGTAGGLMAKEIGYGSTQEEKETFLGHVSARLGIGNIAYLGNALVISPGSPGATPTGIMPVIQWQGLPYALDLNENRLFPVKIIYQ